MLRARNEEKLHLHERIHRGMQATNFLKEHVVSSACWGSSSSGAILPLLPPSPLSFLFLLLSASSLDLELASDFEALV